MLHQTLECWEVEKVSDHKRNFMPSQIRVCRASLCEIFSVEGGGKFILYLFGKNTVLLFTNDSTNVNSFKCLSHERYSRFRFLKVCFLNFSKLQFLFFFTFPRSSPLFSVESLTEMSASSISSAGSAVASAVPSARPRHQKSMSTSGHPVKVTLPTIKDGSEAYRPG